jgi:hypothetical protein
LEDGDRPIPSVTWSSGDLGLTITAFAVDSAGGASAPMRALARRSAGLVARYRVTNHGASEARVTLDLALRPFQVNPPAQFLNTPGGVAPIRGLSRSGAVVVVNGDRGVASLTPPSGFGAAGFDQGDVVEVLRAGALPARERADDPFEHASGALEYALAIPAAGERAVDLFVPFAGIPDAPAEGVAPETVELEERACAGAWRDRETTVTVELPDSAAEVTRTLRAQLAWILINRDGPAIQPGSRSYERSWIRDGALTSSALLRLGHPEEVRDFIEWFARYLYPDGKVPCCVDARGADPVPEHDSGGEFIFLVAEYFRYTGDRALVESLWPAVARAAAHLDTLRQERRTAAWRAAGKEEFFGLLPPSISHEGYSAKPMHSYWDDFFALRGFKDAALLAAALGDERERARLAAVRDTFARDLAASVRAAMARHGIDYVPGCADLGDFDATSTTIALAPAEAEDLLPPGALEKTFERYWENFRDRRDGAKPWVNFTPYEIRTIGAFVRLGWRDRANQLLDFFLAHRSPPEWAQWAEVVWRDARTPHFIGDLPHTWVGSDYVRSVLDMLAYSRERDDALVIGAGVPRAWVERAPGVTVRGLPTPYGPLSYRMAVNRDTVVVSIATGIRVPPGGIVVSAPSTRGFGTAWVDGALVEVERGGGVSVRHLPAEVRLIP